MKKSFSYEIELKYLPKDDSALQEEYAYDEIFDWLRKHGREMALGVVLIALALTTIRVLGNTTPSALFKIIEAAGA